MRIETERLILRPMTADDLHMALKDLPGVVRSYGASMPYIGFWEMRAKRRIYKIKSDIIRQSPRSWLITTSWILIEKKSAIMIGEVGFKGPPVARGSIEIGYGLHQVYRNKGYMTEAVAALTRFAFSQREYRIERVTALTLPENTASHRVLEKNSYARQPSFGNYWLWERAILPTDTAEGMFFD